MSQLELDTQQKNDIQLFVEALQSAGRNQFSIFVMTFAEGNDASWYRFVRGAFNHPITWWIGIFQLQMQMRMWGHHYQFSARSRADDLRKLIQPLLDEALGATRGKNAPLLSAIARYNLRHRKADIAGRLLGGGFTNYASTGGRLGGRILMKSRKAKVTRLGTNFILASYGAAMKAVIDGYENAEAVIQAILTGEPERLPITYRDNGSPLSGEESQVYSNLCGSLDKLIVLTEITPPPVPIKEFCSRPENINLKGMCK